MLSAVEASVRWYSNGSFDFAQDDMGEDYFVVSPRNDEWTPRKEVLLRP